MKLKNTSIKRFCKVLDKECREVEKTWKQTREALTEAGKASEEAFYACKKARDAFARLEQNTSENVRAERAFVIKPVTCLTWGKVK